MEKTICAISTPVGNGGVAIIRISGNDALSIAKKVFPKFNKAPTPRIAYFGKLNFNEVTDTALALYFKAPNSYTGEDVVELQIHGGYYLAQSLIKHLITIGATLAQNGEFSKRAVLNGRMDMSQAEGVIDMINANSLAELKAGSSILNGAMKNFVEDMQEQLTTTMCEVNVALDYPEHDIEYITGQKIAETCQDLIKKIDQKLDTAILGQQVKNGVNVVLAGKPNAGKSSILNALLGFERAIVTDIAGTTRDTVSESYEFRGIKFNIIDTAGLRETEDKVEFAGIKRARQEMEHADIVLEIIDATNPISEINLAKSYKILNKLDLKDASLPVDLKISSKNEQDIIKLKQFIFDKTIDNKIYSAGDYLTNLRHIECLRQAKQALNDTLNACNSVTLDCLAVTLMQAWNKLGEITGISANETIINEIFAKFCLGK